MRYHFHHPHTVIITIIIIKSVSNDKIQAARNPQFLLFAFVSMLQRRKASLLATEAYSAPRREKAGLWSGVAGMLQV